MRSGISTNIDIVHHFHIVSDSLISFMRLKEEKVHKLLSEQAKQLLVLSQLSSIH